jgi:hypothetical protein
MAVYEWDGVIVDDGDARCRGHRISWCPKREVFFYLEDGSPTAEHGGEEKPCIECGLPPTPEGYDACLGRIPGAVAACCGHGVRPGYVMFPRGAQEDPGPWRRARASLSILSPEEVSRLRR